ncbi:phage head closure protein [Burkholderia sp. 22PA0099]|uniref:phage head closure protein n=1 Tax=Burkholderia sp. 22PA0099 TaxID=3237372 RepID=UPI0039C40399
MRIGKLKRQIRIEKRGPGRDPDTGQEIDGWVAIGPPVWADLLMQTGKEAIAANSEVGQAVASIRIRYRVDVDNGMRAVLLKYIDGVAVDDVIFNIGEPLPDFAGRRYVDLPCVTGANDG